MSRAITATEVKDLAEGKLPLEIPNRIKEHKKFAGRSPAIEQEQVEGIILSSAKKAVKDMSYQFGTSNSNDPAVLIPLFLDTSPLDLLAGIVWTKRNDERSLFVHFIIDSKPEDASGRIPTGSENEPKRESAPVEISTEKERVAPRRSKEDHSSSNPKHLDKFAYLGDPSGDDWLNNIAALAGMAQDERWGDESSYGSGETSRYAWLIDYIDRTFQKQYVDGNFKVSPDELFAAFNTGLVTDSYSDIFATFNQNAPGHDKKWRFGRFCSLDRLDYSLEGQKLLKYFGESLPPRAKYFSKLTEVVYDASKKPPTLTCHSKMHIICERLHRFPTLYLSEVLQVDTVTVEIIRAKSTANMKERPSKDKNGKTLYVEHLGKLIKEHAPDVSPEYVVARIGADLEKAIFEAHRRAAINYTVVVPSYNPDRNEMGFALPLRLPYSTSNDTVSVVARAVLKKGKYSIPTILDADEARRNSRLVIGPHDSWLESGKSSPEVRSKSVGTAHLLFEEGAAALRESELATTTDSIVLDVQAEAKDKQSTRNREAMVQAYLVLGEVRHVIDNGATVGTFQSGSRSRPDVMLPNEAPFKYASRRHGTFSYDGGVWSFTDHSKNGTRILREGNWFTLGKTPFPLQSGDEIEFGNGPNVKLETSLGRALFQLVAV